MAQSSPPLSGCTSMMHDLVFSPSPPDMWHRRSGSEWISAAEHTYCAGHQCIEIVFLCSALLEFQAQGPLGPSAPKHHAVKRPEWLKK